MPQRIAQGLLHDPVSGQVHALRYRAGVAADVGGNRDAAVTRRFEQAGQIVQAGLRRDIRLVAAQHAKQPAELVEAGERAGADLGQALDELLGGSGVLYGAASA